MKITIAKSAGFCFGVKRAVKIALEAAQGSDTIDMLGDIVHNEEVVKEIKKAGLKKIKSLSNGKHKTLLIPAHGTSAQSIKRARQMGYKILDASCPMVKEIHRIVKECEKKGFSIIVIGDKKHDEVRGIIGQLKKKALIIDAPGSIPIKKIKKIKKACVVVQSTQTLAKAEKIAGLLKKHASELKFFNTICNPTIKKQQEMKTIPLNNDIVIIIGSKTSANTRRLYEISKSLNKHSYWIQSANDIKPAWFKNAKSVGLTAGSSTPDSTTQSIVEHIKTIPTLDKS